MKRILFVCWYNSARSQMAEGLLRNLGGDKFEAFSAGIESSEIQANAVKVMDEIDIDISGQTSKTTQQYIDQPFDEVITVCDSAEGVCPVFPNAKHRLHWDFHDPEKAKGTDDEIMKAYREARDNIRAKIVEELLV